MRKAAVCPEPGQNEGQGVLSTPPPATPGGSLSSFGHLGQDWALPTKLDPKLTPNPGKQYAWTWWAWDPTLLESLGDVVVVELLSCV